MRVAAGLALLGVGGIAFLPSMALGALGPFLALLLLPAGLLLVRADPALRRAVPAALVAWLALTVAGIFGAGVTVGSGDGALASGGGPEVSGGLLAALFLAPIAPTALLLGLGPAGRSRTLARGGLAALAVSVALIVAGPALASGMPGVVPLVLAYPLTWAALAFHAWPLLRPPMPEPAPA